MLAEDDLTVRARARIGLVLQAKYRLDRLLGVGGMAAVYAATHVRLANRVAIKLLHPELALSPGVRDRFLREGYLANAVDHPGVVRVLDDGAAEDGSLFLVMELLSGEPLEARWVKQGRKLSTTETVTLMLELLSVLIAAHSRRILHRDLKVENLFLATDGRLRVLDFGIARQRVIGGKNTLTGDVFGTPWYMPAEQALGSREVDARSDLWAVGATAFTLLTGRYVHGDGNESVQQALVLASTKAAPPIRSVAPLVPASVAAVIDRALAFRREDRWPSAEAMRDALAAAQDEIIRNSMFDDDEVEDALGRTRVASKPPEMMVQAWSQTRDSEPPVHTLPMMTLPIANTVGGVASDSARRRYPRRLVQALRRFSDAIVRWMRAAHPMVRVGKALRRLGSTLAVLTASSTVRYRRRVVVTAAIGLGASLALGTIALFAVRASSHDGGAVTAAPSIASAAAAGAAAAALSSSRTELTAVPSAAADPESAPMDAGRPPATSSPFVPLKPTASPKPKPMRHDPLAP